MTQEVLRPMAWLIRWLQFCLAGLAGLLLQLGVLSLLAGSGILILPVATLAAVECAILANFAWHHYFTWSDRPCHGFRALLRRFGRYHAGTGLVSLGGASLLTWVLAELWKGHYLGANIAATVICSLLNFIFCDRIAFLVSPDRVSVDRSSPLATEAAGQL